MSDQNCVEAGCLQSYKTTVVYVTEYKPNADTNTLFSVTKSPNPL